MARLVCKCILWRAPRARDDRADCRVRESTSGEVAVWRGAWSVRREEYGFTCHIEKRDERTKQETPQTPAIAGAAARWGAHSALRGARRGVEARRGRELLRSRRFIYHARIRVLGVTQELLGNDEGGPRGGRWL